MGYRRSIGDYFRSGLLIALFVAWILPTVMMVGNSLSSDKSFVRIPPAIFPVHFSVDNYRELLALKLLPRWIANTALVVVVQVVGIILVNGAAAYVFAFSKARWAQWIFWLFMVPIFVSSYILLVPQFVIYGKLGMIGLPAVMMPSVWSTGVFLFRNYFKAIPTSLTESARIDGASEWMIFRKIVMPISKPILGSAAILLSMGVIGSYVWPMLNLRVASQQTYLVGLMASALNVLAIKNVGKDLAIGVMAMVPYFLIFFISSKSFIGGLMSGAMKE